METLGFTLAIIASLSHVIKTILQKKNLQSIDSNTLVFVLSGLSILFWLPFVLYIGIPELSFKLLGVFIFSGILFYVGKLFHFKAMQVEDLSYIAPLKGLVTVMVVLLGFLILNELPNIYGLLGVFIITVGVYFLNIQKHHTKFFDPIIHLFTNRGSQFFLLTSFCYGFTNIFDKIGVLESYPIFRILLMNISLFFFSSFRFIKNNRNDIEFIKNKYLLILATFFFYALGHITQITAIQYIFIGYMSAIKTAGILFSIILGGLFFKEKNLTRKTIIGLFIVLGIILIYLSK